MHIFIHCNEEDDGQTEAVIQSILAESSPARPGDVVHTYFAKLGFDFQLPSTIRVHPGLNYRIGTKESLGTYPALVLPIRDAKGQYRAIELLYLDESGVPAPVINPRQAYWLEDVELGTFMTIQPPLHGACGVTVGFCGALAAHHFTGVPMCVVGSPEDLEAFQIPQSISHLVVFAHSNCIDQAQALQRRAAAEGIATEVLLPSDGYPSWAIEFAFRGAVPIDDIAKHRFNTANKPDEETGND